MTFEVFPLITAGTYVGVKNKLHGAIPWMTAAPPTAQNGSTQLRSIFTGNELAALNIQINALGRTLCAAAHNRSER
jgi:hypothetical protein